MPQNAFFSTNPRSSAQPKNDAKTFFFFFTLHPLSMAIFAAATVLAFVLLRNSKFKSHCYTQREATPTQKSVRKWRCDLSRLLARKITKGIHSCKPALLNRPIPNTKLLLGYGLARRSFVRQTLRLWSTRTRLICKRFPSIFVERYRWLIWRSENG